MSDAPSTDATPTRYSLAFLTDEWEWEAELPAGTLEQARAASREALVDLVVQEKPGLACVTLLEDGLKVGVWDWVEGQAHWTRL